jgi:beta-lactamase regulating signal transducer with metallopeptidase domain
MNMPPVLDASSSFLGHLVDPAVRSLALACMASGALALCRAKNISLRLSVWRIILIVALAMPFLALWMPPLPVSVPIAQRFVNLQSPATVESSVESAADTPATAPTTTAAAPIPAFNYSVALSRNYSRPIATPPARARLRTPISRIAVAAGIYATVAIFFLVRLILGITFGSRLDRNAHAIDDPQALARLHFFAQTARLRSIPRLAESELLSVPVTFGIRHPSILLPATWREWEPTELDAVLAHEISHVARRDALTERLSLLHRAIFWFSPLSWWLDRRLAELAEEASDDAALAAGADRTRYAETVLGFFATLEAAPGRIWWQGVAMASAGQAEKRLDRILEWKGSVAVQLKKPVVIVAAFLAIPVVCLTAAFRPTIEDIHSTLPQSVQPPAPAVPVAPAPAPEPSTVPEPPVRSTPAPAPAPVPGVDPIPTVDISVVPMMRVDPHVVIPPTAAILSIDDVSTVHFTVKPDVHVSPNVFVAPLASIAPHVSVRPVAPQVQQSSEAGHSNPLISGQDDNVEQFVIVSGNSYINDWYLHTDGPSTPPGRGSAFLKSLRQNYPGDFIWFIHDGKAYVIRDPATIKRAMEFFAPAQELGRKQEELGKQQEALGEQQEALGKQQEALGEQMEKVHVKIPDMTAQLQKLEAELKKMSDGGTQEDLGRIQEKIGEIQDRIGELQSQAGDQQSQLGEKQGALGEQQGMLGEQQGKLGDEQAELGRQQEEASKKASQQMKQLLDQAVAHGLAKPA